MAKPIKSCRVEKKKEFEYQKKKKKTNQFADYTLAEVFHTEIIKMPKKKVTNAFKKHRAALCLRLRKCIYHPEFSLLLLLLSRFSRVRLCATPEMAAHQASPSLGFSRQEHWSGLPFPSPMYESEK